MKTYNSDYVNLLKAILTNKIYEPNIAPISRHDIDVCREIYSKIKTETPHILEKYAFLTPEKLAEILQYTKKTRQIHTYVGIPGLNNIEECIREIVRDEIPGDLVDAGTLRGGTAILMRGVLRASGVSNRHVIVADSFQGLNMPGDYDSAFARDVWFKFIDELPQYNLKCHCSLEEVRENFKAYDMLDDQVQFIEGWFHETLPTLKDKRLSLVRIDADWYESSRNVLENLYESICLGGFVIVDDYHLDGCKRAVDEFRANFNSPGKLEVADEAAGIVFWRKQ